MDRLLGTLVAEALLSGIIIMGQTIRLEANDNRIQFCQCSIPDSQFPILLTNDTS